MDGDGDYLLVLKMSEVYFNAPNMKVFDVVLNGDLTVSSDLDIFEKVRSGTVEKKLITPFQVGRGVAHDEYIEFSIEGNTILYQVCIRPKKFHLQKHTSAVTSSFSFQILLI